MECVVIIPKQPETFVRCLELLLKRPKRQAFQSELKRAVYNKSWRCVVKPELEFWNNTLSKELNGKKLVQITQQKNPATGRTNEYLVQIPDTTEVLIRDTHILLKIRKGDTP